MSNNIEHWFHGIIGTAGAWVFSVKLLGDIFTTPTSALVSGTLSILAGILTGFLSKIVNRYFVNQQKDELISQQQCRIIELNRQLNAYSEQLDSNKEAKKKQ